jgi:hypothetical protein
MRADANSKKTVTSPEELVSTLFEFDKLVPSHFDGAEKRILP